MEVTPSSCLLVDYDSLRQKARNVPMSDLMDAVRMRSPDGRVAVRRIYVQSSDSLNHNGAVREFDLEIRPASSSDSASSSANSVQLAAEALDLLHRQPELDPFVIVTADPHLAPLVRLLQLRGRTVIGMGLGEDTARRMEPDCDDYLNLSTLNDDFVGVGGAPATDGAPAGTASEARRSVPVDIEPVEQLSSSAQPTTLADQRGVLGLSTTKSLTSSRLKAVLPLAWETWIQTQPIHAGQLQRAVLRRHPGKLTKPEASEMSTLLERVGALGENGWIGAAGDDSESLFDSLLYSAQQRLRKERMPGADDPRHVGKVLLKDELEAPELRMRILRGERVLQRA